MTQQEIYKLFSQAEAERRVQSGTIQVPNVETCFVCGELLAQKGSYPFLMDQTVLVCGEEDDEQYPGACVGAYLGQYGKKGKYHIHPKEDDVFWHMARSMPDGDDELMAHAGEVLESFHASVMVGSALKAMVAANRFDVLVRKMNRGANFASAEVRDRILDRYKPEPGQVPLWGQDGEFRITVNDCRAWVKVSVARWHFMPHLEFHIIDLDRKFISETGYRSYFGNGRGGQFALQHGKQTVARYAEKVFAELLKTNGRFVDERRAAPLRAIDLPGWVQRLKPAPCRYTRAEQEAPPKGFVKVDVVVSAQQAFIIRKWAEAARPRIEAARNMPSPLASDQAARAPTRWESGMRAKVVRCRFGEPGYFVKVTKVDNKMRALFAHNDQPIRYKTNQKGKRVVDFDPSTVQSVYLFDDLEPADK